MASAIAPVLPQFGQSNCGMTPATQGRVPQLPQSCRTPTPTPHRGVGVRQSLRHEVLVRIGWGLKSLKPWGARTAQGNRSQKREIK